MEMSFLMLFFRLSSFVLLLQHILEAIGDQNSVWQIK